MSTRNPRLNAMQHPIPDRTDWETPTSFFEVYDREFGFTLDVCALPYNAKVPRHFTPEDDGLAQDWSRDVCWMNPPYGAEIPKWMAKAWGESQRGATVVCLVPARTDTRWWHEYAEKGERRFVKGRIRFVGARFTAPFPCAIVVFRPAMPPERAPVLAVDRSRFSPNDSALTTPRLA
jgi:site-specific DNA-methyltransferase (adenine-specific)